MAFPNDDIELYQLKLLIPAEVVGSLVGPAGVIIMDLEKQTGCKMSLSLPKNFYPGTHERVCHLCGTKKSITSTNDIIMDKIRNLALGHDPSNRWSYFWSQDMRKRSEVLKCFIPQRSVWKIIGVDGENIKRLMSDTCTYIRISRANPDEKLQERIMCIKGNQINIKDACEKILELIVADSQTKFYRNVNYLPGFSPLPNADMDGPAVVTFPPYWTVEYPADYSRIKSMFSFSKSNVHSFQLPHSDASMNENMLSNRNVLDRDSISLANSLQDLLRSLNISDEERNFSESSMRDMDDNISFDSSATAFLPPANELRVFPSASCFSADSNTSPNFVAKPCVFSTSNSMITRTYPKITANLGMESGVSEADRSRGRLTPLGGMYSSVWSPSESCKYKPSDYSVQASLWNTAADTSDTTYLNISVCAESIRNPKTSIHNTSTESADARSVLHFARDRNTEWMPSTSFFNQTYRNP